MYLQNVLSLKMSGAKITLFALLLVATMFSSTAFAAGNGPEFYDMSYERYSGKIIVEGYIDDPDDELSLFQITLTGSVSGTTWADTDGYFYIEVTDPGGSVLAIVETEDPDGNEDADGEWLF